MIPDRYVICATVPRQLAGETAVLDPYLRDCWRSSLEQAGGHPIDDTLEIRETRKIRDGQLILPWEDDEGWDAVYVIVIGAAYRPEDPPEPEPAAVAPEYDWEYEETGWGNDFGWQDAATWMPEMEREQ